MRDNKGAIAVFTLLAMLFFLIFVMVIYRNVAAKSRTQVKTTEVLLDIYDTDSSAIYEKLIYDLTNDEDEDEDSYIGYYADVDGDGEVDGIIFADLAVAGSGTWLPSVDPIYEIYDATFSWDAVTSGLKEYELTGATYEDDYFGTGYVIAPVDGTSGTDRFYVMKLSDQSANSDSKASGNNMQFSWWYSAYSSSYGGTTITDYDTVTSADFGAGLTNSTNMKKAWNNETYGSQNYSSSYDDVWSIDDIGSNVGDSDSVWFVPSLGEWAAFRIRVRYRYG